MANELLWTVCAIDEDIIGWPDVVYIRSEDLSFGEKADEIIS